MKKYKDLLQHILNNGEVRADRTGVGTVGVFGYQERFDLRDGFPLLTTKKIHWKSVVHELLWMIKGETNIKYLKDNGVNIWNEWADKDGELGPVYGKQWRKWKGDFDEEGGYNQLSDVIASIKANPWSRRHIVSAWNVADIKDMALPPCHLLFQFNVGGDAAQNPKYLDLQLYQRSCDAFLGVPFNIASYSLLLMMVAQVTNLSPRAFVHTYGDLHLYGNHLKQVDEQLKREPMALPTVKLDPSIKNIDDFKFEHILLENYNCHPTIKAPIAV